MNKKMDFEAKFECIELFENVWDNRKSYYMNLNIEIAMHYLGILYG